MKIAINGFGRIGRLALRIAHERKDIEVVAVNDPSPVNILAHLLKYDTTYGAFDADVKVESDQLVINGKKVNTTQQLDPTKLPWKDLGVDIVIECTGAFCTLEGSNQHITAGAKRVVISAPCKSENDCTFVMGVNHKNFDPDKHTIVSNSSCTTNCITPVAKVLHDAFGIERGFMTTIHAYTNDQRIQDSSHKDLRRARAAAMNMIPTTTGAAKSVSLMIPELKGKIDGISVRVPVATGSLVDLVTELKKDVSAEDVNKAFKKAADGELKGILGYSDEPLVSSDYIKTHYSGVVDALSTAVLDKNMVKVLAWYDNEYGYSMRLIDMCEYVGKKCGY
jgi:glyceraldehyde 3-phosphate dehydrogenase